MAKHSGRKADSAIQRTPAPAMEFEFLREFCRRASADIAVARAASACPGRRAAKVFVPDMAAAISVSPSGSVSMRSRSSATAGALVLDSARLRRLLCGASSLMIALNKTELSRPAGEAFNPDSLRLLLGVQPAMAHIYRGMRAERGVRW